MAGYCGFSKSNNAVMAERMGSFPLTQAKRELKELKPELKLWQAEALLREFGPSEWHHTSSHYNITDYYCVESCLEALEEGCLTIPTERPGKNDKSVTFRAKVRWLEWSGSRKHPKCNEREDMATVTIKGQTATCMTDNNGKVVKRLSTRGFSYEKL